MRIGFLFITLTCILLAACKGGSKNQEESSTKPKITFKDNTYNFGNVSIGEEVTHDFVFKNTGEKSLIIKDLKAGCGCTVPYYNGKPVQPKDTGSIKIEFKPAIQDLGTNNKSVFVYSNAEDGVKILTIKAKVR